MAYINGKYICSIMLNSKSIFTSSIIEKILFIQLVTADDLNFITADNQNFVVMGETNV